MTDQSVIIVLCQIPEQSRGENPSETGRPSARGEDCVGQGAEAGRAEGALIQTAVQPRGTRGRSASGHHRCGAGRIHFAGIHRNAARRRRQEGGRRQGHDLPALQGQGIDVRGTDPYGAGAADRSTSRAATDRRIGSGCGRGFRPHLHSGGGDHPARRHRALDRCGGAAISQCRRFLLPRSGFAWPRPPCAR